MTKTLTIKQYLDERKVLVDELLLRHLQPENPKDPLTSAIRYAVLAPGKRIRPILMLAVAELLGAPTERVYGAACAIELLHTFTLIHDDLPAMDNDDFRRGIPTVHKKFGEATAILAGDALQALAFEILARTRVTGITGDTVLAVISEVAEGIGVHGVSGGQQLDLSPPMEGNPLLVVREIHTKKTMTLFRAAVRSAAILCNASGADLGRLTRFSEHFGLVFQIRDDIQDQSEESGGDTPHALPRLIGLDRAKEELAREARLCRDTLGAYGATAAPLQGLLDYLEEDI